MWYIIYRHSKGGNYYEARIIKRIIRGANQEG